MEKYLKPKEIMSYSLGLFGFQMIVGLLNSYQAEFYNSVLKADFAVVGILILVVKVISSVFDPFIGNKISSKGKLKPFIMYSIIPFSVMTVVVFLNVKLTGIALYAWIFVTFLLWSMAMTIGDVPSQGIASVLTPNPQEKADTISIANTFKEIGFSASAVIVPIVCLLIPGGNLGFAKSEEAINNKEYFVSAIACAVIGCALFTLINFGTKEKVPYKADKMSMKEMLITLKSNKPLMLVVISYIIGAARKTTMAIQVQAANVLLGNQNYVLLFGVCMGVGSVVSMALIPVLLRKFDEKKVAIYGSIYGFVASMAAVLVYDFITTNMVVMFIMMFLVGMQFGIVNIIPMIMVADTVDYHEYKTGKRIEGPAFSVLTLTIKIGLAISAALGLIMLRVANYDATQIALVDKNTLYFAFVGLPGIGSILSIIPLIKYDLTREKKNEIAAELIARRK